MSCLLLENGLPNTIDGCLLYTSRSFLYGTLDDAQQLVNQYSGTGEPKLDRKGNWVHKEHVTVDRVIGEVVDLDTGEATPTHRFAIHYGKRGTHIVPAKEDDHK